MKSADIKVMQQMSQEVVDLLPCGLMIDGNKNYPKNGAEPCQETNRYWLNLRVR